MEDGEISLEGFAPAQPPSLTRQRADLTSFNAFLPQMLQLSIDAGPGCGGVTWPAALVLSRYLAHRLRLDSKLYTGSTALELGSGTGCVALCLALLQPGIAKIIATDMEVLLPLMRENVVLNGLSGMVDIEELSWGGELPAYAMGEVGLLLLADCVYFEPAFPLLVDTMKRLISEKTLCLFCYKKRRKADKHFFIQAKKAGLIFTPVDDDEHRDVYRRDSIFLYNVTVKRRVPLKPV